MKAPSARIWTWTASAALLALALLVFRGKSFIVNGQVNLASLALFPSWRQVRWDPYPPKCKTWDSGLASREGAELHKELQSTPGDLLRRGRMMWLAGECSRAVEIWTQAAGRFPGEPLVHFEQANGNYALGNYQQAYSAYQEILKRFEWGHYFDKRGDLAELSGSPDAAIEWYRISLLLAPSRLPAERLIDLYSKAGRLDEISGVLQRLVDTTSSTVTDHWWGRAQLAWLQEDWLEAGNAYRNAAALSPAHSKYENLLQAGAAFEKAGEWEEGEDVFRQAIDLNPGQLWPYLGAGHIALGSGDYNTALEWYAQADRINPDSAWPEYWQGIVYERQGNCRGAIRFFEQAVGQSFDDNNGDALVRYYLAYCLHKEGQVDRAIAVLRQGIEFSSDKPAGWTLLLGNWIQESGDLNNACVLYRQALEREPGNEAVKQAVTRCSASEKNR